MRLYWGNTGVMKNKMEATIWRIHWGTIGVMENKMESTIIEVCNYCRLNPKP